MERAVLNACDALQQAGCKTESAARPRPRNRGRDSCRLTEIAGKLWAQRGQHIASWRAVPVIGMILIVLSELSDVARFGAPPIAVPLCVSVFRLEFCGCLHSDAAGLAQWYIGQVARVAELVDAQDLGSCDFVVRVQVPSRALVYVPRHRQNDCDDCLGAHTKGNWCDNAVDFAISGGSGIVKDLCARSVCFSGNMPL